MGYIGLPTAVVAANYGYQVFGYDIRNDVVDSINQGIAHIVEPNLGLLLKKVITDGSLTASTSAQASDVYLICVPTPFIKGDPPEPDLSYVFSAVDSICDLLKEEDLIILESTSPVSTTEQVRDLIFKRRSDIKTIRIAYCPERVLPGNILWELVNNDRVVGGVDKESTDRAVNFYKLFVTGEIHRTDAKTAEMCKLVENSYRDINIAYANELSIICEKENINVLELINLANKHPRVNILQPGIGVGGHCIAVDPWFIVARNYKESRLIQMARSVNDDKTVWSINKIKTATIVKQNLLKRAPLVACLGLSFKPNIDDFRESPAVRIVESLIDQGINVIVVDPYLQQHPKYNIKTIKYALKNADILVFLVKHQEFEEIKSFDIDTNQLEIIDLCGLFLSPLS